MFAIRPSRREMYADDATFLWKYSLRALAIVLALVGIGLIGWSLADQVVFPNNVYDDYDYAYYDWPYSNDVWFLPWELITLGLSAVWNGATILVLLRRNRPVPPGANVACDLLLWLGLGVTTFFASVGAETYFWWYPDDSDIDRGNGPAYLTNGTVVSTTASSDPCQGSTGCAAQQSYNGAVTRKGVVIAVGAALGFIVLLMHFALFVSACRYTNARRVNTRAAVVAERMYHDKVGRDVAGDGNPNAGFVPMTEPVEQQAPLDYGMPPAPTGMTVGDKGKRRADLSEERGRGSRYSYEQPEVVVHGPSDEHTAPGYGNDVHEA